MTERQRQAEPAEEALARGPQPRHDDRRRGWLTAAGAALLVALYLVAWLTYTRLHLPPQRYDQQPPGAVASKLGADFTLVGLQQTLVLVGKYDRSETAPSGAVWVVAQLDVTRRAEAEFFNCELVLVGTDGRSWEPEPPLAVSRELENCPPDEVPLGQTSRIETIFQIPEVDADRIAGVAVPQNSTGRDPALTPR